MVRMSTSPGGVFLTRVAVDHFELEAVAVGRLDYRHRRQCSACRRERFDIAGGRRNSDWAAAISHPTLPAQSYRDIAGPDHDRAGTDHNRVDAAVERVHHPHHDDGSTLARSNWPSRVAERPWPAADLAARPDRCLCPDRGRDCPPVPSAARRPGTTRRGG
jgi:hypothetical protein